MRLHEYWRSSASFRVRIGLNLKRMPYTSIPVDLRAGEQQGAYLASTCSSGLVPALETAQGVISQSLAILEFLDEIQPEPAFFPTDIYHRAQVRSLCQTIACDMHPLNNLRVLNYLESELNAQDTQITSWYHHWLTKGFNHLETQAGGSGEGPWFYQSKTSMIDILLIPQIYNALKYGMDMSEFPFLMSVYDHAMSTPEFANAAPENLDPDKK